jgi:hypothetical protein
MAKTFPGHTHTQLSQEPTEPADAHLEVNMNVDAGGEVANENGQFPASDSCKTSVTNEVKSGRVLFIGTQSQ